MSLSNLSNLSNANPTNSKEHTMMGRKRYPSSNKKIYDVDNTQYPFLYEHKKEEGELIKNKEKSKDNYRKYPNEPYKREANHYENYENKFEDFNQRRNLNRDRRGGAGDYNNYRNNARNPRYDNRNERNERNEPREEINSNYQRLDKRHTGGYKNYERENDFRPDTFRQNRNSNNNKIYTPRAEEEGRDRLRDRRANTNEAYIPSNNNNNLNPKIRRDDRAGDRNARDYRDNRDERSVRPDRVEKERKYSNEDVNDDSESSYSNDNRIDSGRNDGNFKNGNDYDEKDKKQSAFPIMKKKFNFLIVLPKNYFRFLEKEYNYLYSEIKKRVRDIDIFQYDHKITNFPDFILRVDAAKVSAKSFAMKIVCELLFECMKQTYQNMSYLKVSILVPSHVVGFIIGIEGKNINTIRDLSGARIDVFQHDVCHKYRQIELQGSPEEISKAAEKIYKIVNKYYFFNQRDEEHGHGKRDRRQVEGSDEVKKKRVRLGGKSRKDKRDASRSQSEGRKEREVVRDREGDKKSSRVKNNLRSSNSKSKSVIGTYQVRTEKLKIKEDDKINTEKDNSHNDSKISPVNISTSQIIQTENKSDIPIAIPSLSLSQNTPTTDKIILEENNLISSTNYPQANTTTNFINDIKKMTDESTLNEADKIPLNIFITNQHLNMLKNIGGNIFIEIENKYHCSISKRVEKLSNIDVNILTLSGTPEQTCMAIYSLQRAMQGKTDIFKN